MNRIKSAKKYGLSDFQLFALFVCTLLGAGITTLPRTAAEQAGRDGWLSIFIAGCLMWLATGLVYLLARRFPDKTLPEYSVLILGKPLGIAVSTGYVAYTLFLGGTALRIFVELVKTWTMIWTPHWAFIVSILAIAVYTARMGAVTLGRLCELIIYLTLPAFLLFLLPLSEVNPLNLMPVGGEGAAAILKGVPEAGFAYLGFEILLVFFPLVVYRQRIFRVYTLALAAVTLAYMATAVSIYGVLGVEQTIHQVWPLINYLRIGTTPFIERVDNPVLFIWTAQVFGVTAIQYYAGSFTAATLAGKRRHDLWALGLAPVLYAIAIAPNRLVDVLMVSDLVAMWGLAYLVGVTALLLAVAAARGLDEGKEGKKS